MLFCCYYFQQVGRKSPYGEGTINIFDTPELSRLGKKKNMSGAAYIGEWITNRVYSARTVSNVVGWILCIISASDVLESL